MNNSSFCTKAYVLLTPTIDVSKGPDPTCALSISFKDDPIGHNDLWVHTMLRCHDSTAFYACNNLRKGDLIFISGARYHVDSHEDGKGQIKRTHYFSHGRITKLMSVDDLSVIKNLEASGDNLYPETKSNKQVAWQEALGTCEEGDDKEPGHQTTMTQKEEWYKWLDFDHGDPDEQPAPEQDDTLDARVLKDEPEEEIPF